MTADAQRTVRHRRGENLQTDERWVWVQVARSVSWSAVAAASATLMSTAASATLESIAQAP